MDLVNKFVEKLIGKHNFLILVISISLSIFSVIHLENLIKVLFSKFIPQTPEALHTIFSLVLSLFFLKISLLVWEKITSIFPSTIRFFKNNEINLIPRISDWIFQGSLKISGDSLELTTSNSGCLIKTHRYKNFIMSFNMEIKNGGHAGIIFRAQDLENYLMIQFVLHDFLDGSGTIIWDIVPHIRYLGNFETFNITSAFPSKPEPYYPTKISYYPGIPVVLEVKYNLAILTIKSEEFRWNIPTHTESNVKQHTSGKEEKDDKKNFLTKIDPLDGKFVPKVWFRNSYGMVGFRAWSWEKVAINNFKIRDI